MKKNKPELTEEEKKEKEENLKRVEAKMARFFGLCGLLGALTLMPPLFNRYFAVAPLLPNETKGLWWFFAPMLLLSVYFILRHKKVKGKHTIF